MSDRSIVCGNLSVRWLSLISIAPVTSSPAPPTALWELNFLHLLGRAPQDQREVSEHIVRCVAEGYDAEIDSYLEAANIKPPLAKTLRHTIAAAVVRRILSKLATTGCLTRSGSRAS